jgi:hypothetical protein
MPERRHPLFRLFLLSACALMPVAVSEEQPDLDPEALSILKATVGSLTGAKAFSFRARASRRRQATNNQIVTYFNEDVGTVSRPDEVRIDVDGEHLQKGMNLTATIVTTTPETISSSTSTVTGTAPVQAKAPPQPATPTQVGALLIEEAAPAPTTVASSEAPAPAAEPKPTQLPKTGSPVPLIGLLGVVAPSAVSRCESVGCVGETVSLEAEGASLCPQA